jgi:hypothetical protein
MQLSGDRLARWMHDPEGSAHQHDCASDHAEAGEGSPD